MGKVSARKRNIIQTLVDDRLGIKKKQITREVTCSSVYLNLKRNHVDKWMFFLGRRRSKHMTAHICLNGSFKT